MDQAFATMKSRPALPSPPFLIKFSHAFEIAFSYRADQQRMMSKTTRQRLIEERVRKGMPVEVAEQEVDEDMGIAVQRRRLADEQARINRDRESLNLGQKQLDEMIDRRAAVREKLRKLPGTSKERVLAAIKAKQKGFATSDYETPHVNR
jgi:hypothetical protein